MNSVKLSAKFLFILLSILSTVTFFNKKPFVSLAETEHSKAECVMEKESRRILYEYNGDRRLPIASTTKIATAITVLEECECLEEKFQIPNEAIGIEGSSIYLKEGDIYSSTDLLYGLMLRSGNDSAVALAIRTASSIPNFCVKMNEIAQKAGALHTNFKNPHGLPLSGHYSTARDLSYITCYALHNTMFEKIVSTKYYPPFGWKNKNKLLSQYSYAIGVKTGYTKEAGRCLVSAGKKDDMTIVCSVLSCPDMYNRSIALLDDCFEKYKRVQLLNKNEIFKMEVNGRVVSCKSKCDFFYPLQEEELEYIEIITTATPNLMKTSDFTRKKEEIYGKIEIYLLKRLIFSSNLYKL